MLRRSTAAVHLTRQQIDRDPVDIARGPDSADTHTRGFTRARRAAATVGASHTCSRPEQRITVGGPELVDRAQLTGTPRPRLRPRSVLQRSKLARSRRSTLGSVPAELLEGDDEHGEDVDGFFSA